MLSEKGRNIHFFTDNNPLTEAGDNAGRITVGTTKVSEVKYGKTPF